MASLGHFNKFQLISRLGFVTAPTSLTGGQQNFARCLAVSWAGTLYIHFGAPNGILPGAKFTLRPSLAFSYIGSVTARHSSNGRQPKFVSWYKEWNYRIFTAGATCIRLGGHHVGHRPTYSNSDRSVTCWTRCRQGDCGATNTTLQACKYPSKIYCSWSRDPAVSRFCP